MIPSGSICSPLDLKAQFLRPVWPDGHALRATARVVHQGKRFATASGRVVDDAGSGAALGMSSFVIIDGKTWDSITVADDYVGVLAIGSG